MESRGWNSGRGVEVRYDLAKENNPAVSRPCTSRQPMIPASNHGRSSVLRSAVTDMSNKERQRQPNDMAHLTPPSRSQYFDNKPVY